MPSVCEYCPEQTAIPDIVTYVYMCVWVCVCFTFTLGCTDVSHLHEGVSPKKNIFSGVKQALLGRCTTHLICNHFPDVSKYHKKAETQNCVNSE